MTVTEITQQSGIDAGQIGRAKLYTTSEQWRDAVDEWIVSTYGARALKIGQRFFPPDTQLIDAPKWSIRERAETAREKRDRLRCNDKGLSKGW